MKNQVTWTPKELDLWTYGDEWMNEFSAVTDEKLSPTAMEDYFEWSHHEVSGVVDHTDEDFVYIMLDQPAELNGEKFELVAYPLETLEVIR